MNEMPMVNRPGAGSARQCRQQFIHVFHLVTTQICPSTKGATHLVEVPPNLRDGGLESFHQSGKVIGICNEVIKAEPFECLLIAICFLPQCGASIDSALDPIAVGGSVLFDQLLGDVLGGRGGIHASIIAWSAPGPPVITSSVTPRRGAHHSRSWSGKFRSHPG